MVGRRGRFSRVLTPSAGRTSWPLANTSIARWPGWPAPAEILDARTDGWARADRVAWGDVPADRHTDVPEVARLLAARRSVSAPSQLVHGDLSGNVLFAKGLPPAVIDLSPYWRPVAYASTIVLADAVLWHGADVGLLSTLADDRDGHQLLIRALLFRLLSERAPPTAAAAYRPAVDYACRLPRS